MSYNEEVTITSLRSDLREFRREALKGAGPGRKKDVQNLYYLLFNIITKIELFYVKERNKKC